jgi:hypothetical protein
MPTPTLPMHRRFYPLSSPLASLLCHQHLGSIELQFELSDQERDILAHLGWVGVHGWNMLGAGYLADGLPSNCWLPEYDRCQYHKQGISVQEDVEPN